MAVRRSALAGAAPFSGALGNKRGLHIATEEAHFFTRLRRSGELVYTPVAVVHHCIAPERISWDAMRAAWYQGGIGQGIAGRLAREERPSPLRLVVRTARLVRGAVGERRRNVRTPTPSAQDAWREFSTYAWAGRHIGLLLGRFPRVATWVAARVP
jgi:hypothetical protein